MYIKAIIVLAVALLYIKLTTNKNVQFDAEKHVRGQNVLVTGASSGIGEQLAYTYAKMGANVYITARREELLQKVLAKCKEIGAKDAKFGYTVADMEIHELAAPDVINDAVTLLGGLDQVILNHAIIMNFARWNGTEEDMLMFEKVTEVNYMSYVQLTALSLPYLRKSNGKLAVISSIGGKLGMPYISPYSGSKFALDGFFSSLRREFLNHDETISITLCFLGLIDTPNVIGKFNEFYTNYNINEKRMEEVMTKGRSSEAAEAITKATATRKRECYHPLILGAEMPWRIMTAIRNVWPDLVEFDLRNFLN